jgi:Uncharacterised nucleotidyltransferase
MQTPHTNTRRAFTKRSARELVLLSFCESPPEELSRLRNLSSSDWRKLLHWLDISGLALYFFDRITKLGLREMLPSEVTVRLKQNLTDNTARALGMMEEQTSIQLGFQGSGVSYAVLKGFSLWPSSVPRPELRSQLDLDFLVAEKDAPAAREILEARGYRLKAISGRSWEFKTNEKAGISLRDLYRNLPQRTVELHLESDGPEKRSLLARTEKRWLGGICTPVLSPVDLFLGQGLHVYKHVCSESSRAAHLVEFHRHVVARRDDAAFWKELRLLAEENQRTPIALGVATLLIARVMGNFAPKALTCWTVDRLPAGARLWVELYGHRSVFHSFPGSKLYLLLQKELEGSGAPAKRSLMQSLVPRKLPPAIVHAPANEKMFARFRRYQTQLWFISFRLRFHIVEGLRYLHESRRWQQRLNEFSS